MFLQSSEDSKPNNVGGGGAPAGPRASATGSDLEGHNYPETLGGVCLPMLSTNPTSKPAHQALATKVFTGSEVGRLRPAKVVDRDAAEQVLARASVEGDGAASGGQSFKLSAAEVNGLLVGFGNALKEDPYVAALLGQRTQPRAPTPRFVVVGQQSSGKSTVVDRVRPSSSLPLQKHT
jgi:hypothetical protein